VRSNQGLTGRGLLSADPKPASQGARITDSLPIRKESASDVAFRRSMVSVPLPHDSLATTATSIGNYER
jgi:hypothetical protein